MMRDHGVQADKRNEEDRHRKKRMRIEREEARTPEQKKKKKENQNSRQKKSRSRRSPVQKKKANEANRQSMERTRSERTHEQRLDDNEAARLGMRSRRDNRTREQYLQERMAASEAEHSRRDNFTPEQWARHRKSNRYQQCLSRWRAETANLPAAMRCNMDIFDPCNKSLNTYFNVGPTDDWEPDGKQITLKMAAEDGQYKQFNDEPGRPCECTEPRCKCRMQVVICQKCKAIGFKNENKISSQLRQSNKLHMGTMCCNNGKHTFPDLPDLPPTLYKLYTEDNAEAKYFRRHMRMFNCGLAMASCTFNDKSVPGGVMKICGEIHRRVGSFQQPTTTTAVPKCIQLYCHDPEYQAAQRAKRNCNETTSIRDKNLILDLYRKTRLSIETEANNSYLKAYKIMLDYIEENNLNPEELRYELHATDKPPEGQHPGRYNLPSAPEIAMLMPTTIHNNAERSIVCSLRQSSDDQNELRYFPQYHRSYPPLAYPLLFPKGTDGWTLGIRSLSEYNGIREGITSLQNVELAPYTRFYLAERAGKLNYLLLANRLYQQHIIDSFCRIEIKRLQWIRCNQRKIRADLYGNLRLSAQNNSVENSGVATILPASVTCSDRWYHSAYSDAMAIVRIYGKPDFFVTFTFDIGCPEVKVELKPGQTPYDRPDLLCKVFNLKRDEFIKDIKHGVLGTYKAHVSVIEFQKRGAPHAHTLVWLKDFDHTPQNVDNVISSEIPPRGEEGTPERDLHELVMKLMIHGPCGQGYNGNFGCVKGGKPCSKDYPKDFSSNTTAGDDTFVKTRRRSPSEGGHVGTKKRSMIEIDNRWVVPYNIYFLLKYRSHINVENCNAVQAVKYLFLYHFKGEDMVTIEDEDMLDEVKKFTTQRYISACYAYWRIFFPEKMISMYPSVKKLKLHVENSQRVLYEPTQSSAEDELRSNESTMLTAYFDANGSKDDEKRQLANEVLYEDFPSKFVFKSGRDGTRWEVRQKQDVTGRILPVHPSNQELFYLRVLLKNVKGAKSFEELRTYKGQDCGTNKAACVARGLCEDDSQWKAALDEAAQYKRPRALRYCFVNILIHCWPVGPRELFDEFANHMSEDFERKRKENKSLTPEEISKYTRNDLLQDLNDMLGEHNKSNVSFNIDMPEQMEEPDVVTDNTDQIDDNASNDFDYMYPLVEKNDEQMELFEGMKDCIDNETGGLFNLDAPGGSGKTFLSNFILCYIRKHNDIAIAAAMSGIASTLMKLATTFHKRFGCPIPCFGDSTSKHKLNSNEALLIKKAKIIIIDEVSMMHYKQLEMLDRFLKELMKSDKYMGGKLIILMHDFRQILPVVPGGTRAMISASSIIHSEMWPNFTTLRLTRNMRIENMKRMDADPATIKKLEDYSKWLLSIGDGTVTAAVNNIIEIPSHMVCKDKQALESSVYDDFLKYYNDPKYLERRAIMSGTNDTIQQCNFEMIQKLPGAEVISKSLDTCIEEKDQQQYDVDFLNKINASGIAPHKLLLKPGACIILIKNLNVKMGHCNGSRYIIKNVTERIIFAQKLGGGIDSEVLIPRIPMISKETDFPVPFKRIQFPVLGAYYLTFNRAQGQSLERSGLYLPQSVFSHGHLYVGFSRCGDPDNVYVYADQAEFENLSHLLDEDKVYTRNIVYKEVF